MSSTPHKSHGTIPPYGTSQQPRGPSATGQQAHWAQTAGNQHGSTKDTRFSRGLVESQTEGRKETNWYLKNTVLSKRDTSKMPLLGLFFSHTGALKLEAHVMSDWSGVMFYIKPGLRTSPDIYVSLHLFGCYDRIHWLLLLRWSN